MGLEKPLRIELEKLGATGVRRDDGAIHCDYSPSILARINVQSRLAHRVLIPLANVKAATQEELVEALSTIPFEKWITEKDTIAVQSILRDAAWDHSHYAAQRIKDVVVDRMRAQGRARPDVDPQRPTHRLVFYWKGQDAILSLDTSGKALHQRGYRRGEGKAPLRETMAAGILALAHADVRRPFWDPCGGTGTLAIEQAWRALKRAPGRDRHFNYERWDFLGDEVKKALEDERQRARDEEMQKLNAPIYLSDHNPDMVEEAETCVARAGMKKHIHLREADARYQMVDEENLVVATNLPFGERLGRQNLQLDGFYRSLGEHWAGIGGARIIVYSGNFETRRLLNLGKASRWPLRNGPLAATVYRWDLEKTTQAEENA